MESFTPAFGGWVNAPDKVQDILRQLPNPLFQTPSVDRTKDVFNHLLFKQQTGHWYENQLQEIGDCVGFGFGHMVDYSQVLDNVYNTNPNMDLEYYSVATEVIYAGSRVQIGGGRINGDGSVGAWAAKYLKDYGAISRNHLKALGYDPKYSGNRARLWGQNGAPVNVVAETKLHGFADVTMVTNFNQAAWHIQNGRTIAVCSNIGFENGGNGRTRRDNMGFAAPRGSWAHCMHFSSCRFDRPGLLIENQWPSEMVNGPTGPNDIPPCSWWVDEAVVNQMLSQNDSWTGTSYNGYPARNVNPIFVDWIH